MRFPAASALPQDLFRRPVVNRPHRGAVFNLGTFQLDTGLIAISAVVPETAIWGMMIRGFGVIGGALRRRSITMSYA